MSDPFRVVLVGCGSISAAWLRPAVDMPDIKFVGLVDRIDENARKRAVEFNLADSVEIGTDLRAVLKKTKPDMVFDCTVPEAHVNVALEAFRHGCHVLGEKPLADSMANARRIVRAAQKAGRTHAVIQNRRFDANIRSVRKLVEGGQIGTLTALNSDFFIGAHFGGFRDHMKHVLLLDMAIHTFDAARLLGGGDPVSVYCKEWNPAGSWYDHDASAVALFTMSNGVVYTYRGSWCAEGMNTTWESTWHGIGTKGSFRWDGAKDIQAQAVKTTGSFISSCEAVPVAPFDDPSRTGSHGGQILDYVNCVRNGTLPETVCTDNIKSLAMVFAAVKSAATGKEVLVKW
ncbi:MAG: Gfo/Idh/MocA family oxidoreductase [bacterium]